jgi:hypothetical protein
LGEADILGIPDWPTPSLQQGTVFLISLVGGPIVEPTSRQASVGLAPFPGTIGGISDRAMADTVLAIRCDRVREKTNVGRLDLLIRRQEIDAYVVHFIAGQ